MSGLTESFPGICMAALITGVLIGLTYPRPGQIMQQWGVSRWTTSAIFVTAGELNFIHVYVNLILCNSRTNLKILLACYIYLWQYLNVFGIVCLCTCALQFDKVRPFLETKYESA